MYRVCAEEMAAYIGYLGAIWCNNTNLLQFNTSGEQIGYDVANCLCLGIALLALYNSLFTEFIAYVQEDQGILWLNCPDNSLTCRARPGGRFIGRKRTDPIYRVRGGGDRKRAGRGRGEISGVAVSLKKK